MPLSMMGVGAKLRIKAVGGNASVRRHLGDMGFVEGAEVTVIAEMAGSLIIGVHETRGPEPRARAENFGLTKEGESMKTLKDVKIGACAKIVRLHGVGAVRRRILDMGLVKGTEVTVCKVAPAGDPIELTVRGYELSIRKDEAATIEVD